ncbi:MAG TPA: divalent-cation tolerance protein CutA [Gemmatimonadales bacterium]|nr:divalent-cation tolerance protein CutA [Gemmatimonadales bacterium]
MTECCQVTTTWPDQTGADRAADSLVAERLAACAQVHGPLVSTFSWKGSIERGREWYCHFKTTMDRLPALQQRIQELHPYEVPEIIALPILGGNPAYLEWIRSEVNAKPAG